MMFKNLQSVLFASFIGVFALSLIVFALLVTPRLDFGKAAAALAAALVLAAGLSMILSRAITRPIVRLSGVARRIARGEFPVAIERKSGFEMGKLEEAVEQMSLQLADSFKYRSEFVANVSHELKTPLTAIRSYVETLLSGAIDDKEHNLEFLKKIERRAVNLSYLIDDILALSHLESKKEPGLFTDVSFNEAINRAVEMLGDKAKGKGVILEKHCSQTVSVRGNEEQIYRAVLNLLDNAINYTNPDGKVEISCGPGTVTVKDSGIGIPKEHLGRIFERFYRVDKARSRELGGTGLGLAIVKHVMNTHNGSVSVQSETGKGSEFTLVFPGVVP